MSQQLAQRDGVLFSEGVFRNLPALQIAIHIRIEIELAGLNQAQHRKRGNRLADRGRLEECLRGDWRPADSGDTETAGPLNRTVVNDRDADTRDVQLRHTRGQPGPGFT
jgi:hypothetical protein